MANHSIIIEMEAGTLKKALIVTTVWFLMTTVVAADLIELGSGMIKEAHLEGRAIDTQNWLSVRGLVDEQPANPDINRVSHVNYDGDDSGEIFTIDNELEAELNGKYFFMFTHRNIEYDIENMHNASDIDLASTGAFQDYETFYPDYYDRNDNPEETFVETDTIVIGNETYETRAAPIEGNTLHFLPYEHEGDTIPLFFSRIEEDMRCFDNTPCNFQMMLPAPDSDSQKEYSIYLLSEFPPVELNTVVDGEETTELERTAVPYNVDIETEWLYNQTPVEQEVTLFEEQGNNLFMLPAKDNVYQSTAWGTAETEFDDQENPSRAYTEMVIAPTKRQVPDSYTLMAGLHEDYMAGHTELFTIEHGDEIQPESKDLGEYHTPYVEGVNRLRPIADCVFESLDRLQMYEVFLSETETIELVRGKPYVLSFDEFNVETVELTEDNSHLVLHPVRDMEGQQIDHRYKGSPEEIIITPTLSSGETFSARAMNEEGDTVYETTFEITEATCDTIPNLSRTNINMVDEGDADLQEQINAVRPVLNSMFVAGS